MSAGDRTKYLKNVGSFLKELESLIDRYDDCHTIWNSPSKQLLCAKQSYVDYKYKMTHKTETVKHHSVINNVINMIVAQQILVLQTTPSSVAILPLERSESDIMTADVDVDVADVDVDVQTTKKAKWW